jgi:hypothetical protein
LPGLLGVGDHLAADVGRVGIHDDVAAGWTGGDVCPENPDPTGIG